MVPEIELCTVHYWEAKHTVCTTELTFRMLTKEDRAALQVQPLTGSLRLPSDQLPGIQKNRALAPVPRNNNLQA